MWNWNVVNVSVIIFSKYFTMLRWDLSVDEFFLFRREEDK